MPTPAADEIDQLLATLAPVLANEADLLLDLRDLLKQRGHPGKCVRCFFELFEVAGENARIRLKQLQNWLERHVELRVSSKGETLETLPFAVRSHEGLEEFCRAAIQRIRMDRSYKHKKITIAFQYRDALAA